MDRSTVDLKDGLVVSVRAYDPQTDLPLIISTWLKSYRTGPFARRITDDVYYDHHKRIVPMLLGRAQTLVACDPDDSYEIFGYLTCEVLRGNPVLHYAYTKNRWRRLGIMTALIAASPLPPDLAGVHVSHAGPDWFDGPKDRRGLESRFPNARYNPYSL